MKKMNFAKLFSRTTLMIIFCCVSFTSGNAQTKDFPNFKTGITGKGVMLMNQKGTPDYAILIEGGTEAEYDARDDSVKVKIADGEIAAYYTDAKIYTKTKADTAEVLMKNYRTAQLAKIEAERKQKITIDEDFSGELPAFDLRQGKDEKVPVYSSFWSFPLSGAKPERRIYLAVVIGDSILTLRKDLFNGENAQEQSGGFVGALKTLTLLPPQKIITPLKMRTSKSNRKGK